MQHFSDIRAKFQRGLDITKPDWFIVFASQQELAECVRACTDGRSGTVEARVKLRRDVAERLFDVLHGAIEGGILQAVKAGQ